MAFHHTPLSCTVTKYYWSDYIKKDAVCQTYQAQGHENFVKHLVIKLYLGTPSRKEDHTFKITLHSTCSGCDPRTRACEDCIETEGMKVETILLGILLSTTLGPNIKKHNRTTS